MPNNSRKQYVNVSAAAQTESFEPYGISILVIVLATFTLYGAQSLSQAVGMYGFDKVSTCFGQSSQAAYHRFMTCTTTSLE